MSHLRKVFERERGFKAEGHYGGFDAVYVEWLETKVEKLTSDNKHINAICNQPDTHITCADRSNKCEATCDDCDYKQRNV